MCPLDNPAPGFGAGLTLGPGFLATAAQMERKGKLLRQGPRLVIVEALVEAEVLRVTAGRFGPLHRDGLKGLAHQLMVVAIGAVDHGPEGDAAAVGQQRAFDPALASVGRIAAGFPPPSGALPIAPSSASQVQSIPFRAS